MYRAFAMYDNIAQLLAANPSFQIPGGRSNYAQPVMPGEQRLIPSMQQKVPGSPSPVLPGATPALPPVREAFGLPVNPNEFLAAYLQSNRLA